MMDWEGHFLSLEKLRHLRWFLVLIDRDDGESLVSVFLYETLHDWKGGFTRRTPRSPEVVQHDFAFEIMSNV